MEAYLSKSEAVIDMHIRGYCDDFELFGNDLLWIQEKIFIREKEFVIQECHYLHFENGLQKEVILFGVIAINYNVKGILMNHYSTYTPDTPVLIVRKIRDLFCRLNERDKNPQAFIAGDN
ncbi:MAG: hypothetical protein ABIQ31_01310 [Ferruginibacter sp.]